MDKALKQRLVGAIVLIALAVIVLPMIFGGRPSSDGPGPSEIELPSPPPDLEFETRRFPVGDQPVPQPSSEPATQDVPEEAQPELTTATPVPDQSPASTEVSEEDQSQPGIADAMDEPVAEEQVPEVVQETERPAQAAATESQVTDEPDTSSLRYVVQVASFGSIENATRLAGQLETAGYAVLLDHVSSETSQLNRVRVGPYASEDGAQTVVRELREQFEGVNPRIVDLQPDQATPAIVNEDPLLRWVVQVGSFSSSENAQNLVARLRLLGLSSYDETISNDTATIYRVRVGPFLDRDEAIRVEQQIRAELGIEGVVMSSD